MESISRNIITRITYKKLDMELAVFDWIALNCFLLFILSLSMSIWYSCLTLVFVFFIVCIAYRWRLYNKWCLSLFLFFFLIHCLRLKIVVFSTSDTGNNGGSLKKKPIAKLQEVNTNLYFVLIFYTVNIQLLFRLEG